MARDGREFCLLEALERYFSELQIKMKTNDCRIEILRLKNALSLLIEEIESREKNERQLVEKVRELQNAYNATRITTPFEPELQKISTSPSIPNDSDYWKTKYQELLAVDEAKDALLKSQAERETGLQSKLEEKEAILTHKKTRMKSLKSQLNNLTLLQTEFSNNFSIISEDVGTIMEKLNSQRKHISSLENKHISIVQTIKDYKETIQTTEEKVVSLEGKLQQEQNKYHETLIQKEKNEIQISTLETEIARLNEKIRDTNVENHLLIQQKNEMSLQLCDLTSTLMKFEKTIEELVQEKCSNSWSHENLRNNLLLEISNSSNVRVGELEQKINSLNEEKVCFEEKYEKLKASHEYLEGQIQELTTQKDNLISKELLFEKQFKRQEAEIKEMKEMMIQKENSVTELLNQIDELKTNIFSLEETIGSLREEIKGHELYEESKQLQQQQLRLQQQQQQKEAELKELLQQKQQKQQYQQQQQQQQQQKQQYIQNQQQQQQQFQPQPQKQQYLQQTQQQQQQKQQYIQNQQQQNQQQKQYPIQQRGNNSSISPAPFIPTNSRSTESMQSSKFHEPNSSLNVENANKRKQAFPLQQPKNPPQNPQKKQKVTTPRGPNAKSNNSNKSVGCCNLAPCGIMVPCIACTTKFHLSCLPNTVIDTDKYVCAVCCHERE